MGRATAGVVHEPMVLLHHLRAHQVQAERSKELKNWTLSCLIWELSYRKCGKKDLGENEVECTRKAEIRKGEIAGSR